MEFIHEKSRVVIYGKRREILAEITFPETEPGIADINHTFVDESLRGQGIAGKLMEEAVRQIRAEGKKMKTSCSYAAGWMVRHPEEGDLLKER